MLRKCKAHVDNEPPKCLNESQPPSSGRKTRAGVNSTLTPFHESVAFRKRKAHVDNNPLIRKWYYDMLFQRRQPGSSPE
jgi:hypothetical protein